MKKMIGIFCMALVLTLAVPGAAFAADSTLTPETELQETLPSRDFTDVRPEQWFYEDMDLLVRSGGIDGYEDGSFRPDEELTLGEFLKIMTSLLYGEQVQRWADYEIDGQSRWYAPYVGCAQAAGLLDGVTYSGASLDAPADRYTMAGVLVNAAEAMGAPLTDDPEIRAIIGDYEDIPEAYRTSVRMAYTAGILNGMDAAGNFSGESGLRRSEACAAVVRLFRESERVSRVYEACFAGDYSVAVVMPGTWAERYIPETGSDETSCWVSIHCAAAWNAYGLEGGGHLLTGVLADELYDYPQSEYLGMIGERYASIVYPSDVQFDETSMAEYQAMQQDITDGNVYVVVKFTGQGEIQ